MKIFKITMLSFMAAGFMFFIACTAGNAEKGKALFNDVNFAGSSEGKSCNSCHLDGKGLEKSGEKKEFDIMGQELNSLEEAVNFCIEAALDGEPIDPGSEDMTDIIAYIKSLK